MLTIYDCHKHCTVYTLINLHIYPLQFPPVHGVNARALVSGLSLDYDKSILNHRPCTLQYFIPKLARMHESLLLKFLGLLEPDNMILIFVFLHKNTTLNTTFAPTANAKRERERE